MNKDEWGLYRVSAVPSARVEVSDGSRYDLVSFSPKFMDLLKSICGKNRFINEIGLLSVAYFWVIPKGKYRIYLAETPEGEVAYHCAVHGKNFKFPWMSKDDYQIASCYTNEAFRGRNIYPWALVQIMAKEKGNACMFIRKDNIASQRGVAKAGFECVGTIKRRRSKCIVW